VALAHITARARTVKKRTRFEPACARAGYALRARSFFAELIIYAVLHGLEQKYLLYPLVTVFMSTPHSRQTEILVFAVKNQSHLIMVGGALRECLWLDAHIVERTHMLRWRTSPLRAQ